MRPIALLGDSILCFPCDSCPFPRFGPYNGAGAIVQVNSYVMYVRGRPVALVGDMGICGGPTILVEGSQKMFVAGRPVHRVGDLNQCGGPTTGPGDPTVIIGD